MMRGDRGVVYMYIGSRLQRPSLALPNDICGAPIFMTKQHHQWLLVQPEQTRTWPYRYLNFS